MKETVARPTHIVAHPGDRVALCGAKKPLPVVAQKFAPLHNYLHARCRICYEHAGLASMLP